MIAVRISPSLYNFDEALDRLLEIDGACDEIWLGFGSYCSLEESENNVSRIMPAVDKIKAAGKRVIMELGSNLGHGSQIRETAETKTFEKMRGCNGGTGNGAFCPRGKNFIAHQKAVMRIMAKTMPYGFYLDDDLRIEYHGEINFGCFCDDCIALFNKTCGTGYSYDRVCELVASDPDTREKYILQNREGMAYYAYELSSAIKEICPEVYVGWENVLLGGWNGPDYNFMFDSILRATGRAPMSRPGCLVYNDHQPRLLIDKIINISYQNAVTPDYVKVKRPEIENCSETVMGKSIQGTCVEASLNLAYGCSGLSVSMISDGTEPIEPRVRMWHAFENHRTYWQKIINDQKDTGVGGVELVMSKEAFKAVLANDSRYECKWAQIPMKSGRQLAETGLPVSYEKDFCNVKLLACEMIDYMPDSEIKELLAANVITDGTSVQKLYLRGFGSNLPMTAEPFRHVSEVCTGHPANRECAGRHGYVDSFTEGVTYQKLLIKDENKCEILSKSGDHVISAIMHTTEGGKWAIIGSSLRSVMINSIKCRQLTAVADYIGGIPCWLNTIEQVMVIPRVKRDGQFKAVTLQNISIGETAPLEITVKNPVSEIFTLSRPLHGDIPLSFTRRGNEYIIKLPVLGVWKTATVRAL